MVPPGVDGCVHRVDDPVDLGLVAGAACGDVEAQTSVEEPTRRQSCLPGAVDQRREHVHPSGEVAVDDLREQLLLGAEDSIEGRLAYAAGLCRVGRLARD